MDISTVGSLVVGAVEGPHLTAEESALLARYQPAGITLFRRNIPESWREVAALNRAVAEVLRGDQLAPMIAIDQEGGRVARIRAPDFPDRGAALELEGGRFDDAARDAIQAYGAEVGEALKSAGININFAPVADILTEPDNTAIGDRVFGTDVEQVLVRAGAFLDGQQSTGVVACLKHFPGQGDASVDTHAGRAVVDLPRDLLDQREILPFRALMGRCPLMMISHCVYPQLDDREASRSAKVIGGLLRGEMRYQGLVVSDDMNMGALPQDEDGWAEAIIDAVAAGVDLVLVCRHMERTVIAVEALQKAAAKSKAMAQRIEESAARVREFRGQLFSP